MYGNMHTILNIKIKGFRKQQKKHKNLSDRLSWKLKSRKVKELSEEQAGFARVIWIMRYEI